MERDPLVRLLLVGDGPFRSECTSLVRRAGIGDRVRFIGFLPRSEVDRYYTAADLFVFSSISETQGLVVQEAMSHEVPAIAVAGGGASASIRNGYNGFVVKNDASIFARQVLEVLNDEQLYLRLSEGAGRSVRHLGLARMAEQVLEVYRDALTHKSTEGRIAELAGI